jgi:hypothetical protein
MPSIIHITVSQSLGTFSVGQGLPGYFAGKAPTIVLDNTDFDLGRVGWGQESQNFPSADSGTRLAWLDRINGETSALSQVIDVPAGVGPSFLKFRYQITSVFLDSLRIDSTP